MLPSRTRHLLCQACRNTRSFSNTALKTAPKTASKTVSKTASKPSSNPSIHQDYLESINIAINSNRITDAVSLIEQWKVSTSSECVSQPTNQTIATRSGLTLEQYNSVLKLCVHCSDPISAITVIRSMIEQSTKQSNNTAHSPSDVQPNTQSWCYMIDCLTRRHQLEPAWQIYKSIFHQTNQTVSESQLLVLRSLIDHSIRHNPATDFSENVENEIEWLSSQSRNLSNNTQSAQSVKLDQLINQILIRSSANKQPMDKSDHKQSMQQLQKLIAQGPPKQPVDQSFLQSLNQQSMWCKDMIWNCARIGDFNRAIKLVHQLEKMISQSNTLSTGQSSNTHSQDHSLRSVLSEVNSASQLIDQSNSHSSFQSINSSLNRSVVEKSLLQSYISILIMSRAVCQSGDQSAQQLSNHHERVAWIIDHAQLNRLINDDRLLIALVCCLTPTFNKSTKQSFYESINQFLDPLKNLGKGIPLSYRKLSLKHPSSEVISQSVSKQRAVANQIMGWIKKYSMQPSSQLMELLVTVSSINQPTRRSTDIARSSIQSSSQMDVIQPLLDLYLANGTFPSSQLCASLISQSLDQPSSQSYDQTIEQSINRDLAAFWTTYSALNAHFGYSIDLTLIDRLLDRSLRGLIRSSDPHSTELPQIIDLINQTISRTINQASPRTLSGVLISNASLGGEQSVKMIDSITQSVLANDLTINHSPCLLDLLIGLCSRSVRSIDCTLLVNLCKKHWQIVTPLEWQVVTLAEQMTRTSNPAHKQSSNLSSDQVTADSLVASWAVIQKLQSRTNKLSNQTNQPEREFVSIRLMLKHRRKAWLTQGTD